MWQPEDRQASSACNTTAGRCAASTAVQAAREHCNVDIRAVCRARSGPWQACSIDGHLRQPLCMCRFRGHDPSAFGCTPCTDEHYIGAAPCQALCLRPGQVQTHAGGSASNICRGLAAGFHRCCALIGARCTLALRNSLCVSAASAFDILRRTWGLQEVTCL